MKQTDATNQGIKKVYDENKNENEGHRERFRDRIVNNGMESMQDHEILEGLLFGTIRRANTNRLAHRLINSFGSLDRVIDASYDQLVSVNGVGKAVACHILLIKECGVRCERCRAQGVQIRSVADILNYARTLLAGRTEEAMIIMYLDGDSKLIKKDIKTSGSPNSVFVEPTDIVRTALNCSAQGVIMCHSHVWGPCQPSEADRQFTQRMEEALHAVNIVLMDHVIFNSESFYSFSFEKSRIGGRKQK